MIEEIICSKKGEDKPGIHWEKHILICRTKDEKETHFINWVKVYEKGYRLPPDSVAVTYLEMKNAETL